MRRRAMMGVDAGGGLHGQYHPVTFVDHTGNVIADMLVQNGTACIPPTPPTYKNLVFDHWTHDTSNVTHDMVVGAKYNTADESMLVYVDNVSDATADLPMGINKASATGSIQLKFELFEESTDALVQTFNYTYGSASGLVKHIMNVPPGKHYAKVTPLVNTSLLNLGISTTNAGILTGIDDTKLHVTKLFIGNRWRFFRNSLNNSTTWLEEVIIPEIGKASSNEAAGVVRPLDVTASTPLFTNCPLKALIIESTYSVQQKFLNNNPALRWFVVSDAVQHSGSSLTNCPLITKFISSSKMTSITNGFINNCQNLSTLVFRNPAFTGTIVAGGGNSVKKIVLVKNVLATGASATPDNINADAIIYVPDTLLSSYMSTAPWSSIPDQIKPMSELNIQ